MAREYAREQTKSQRSRDEDDEDDNHASRGTATVDRDDEDEDRPRRAASRPTPDDDSDVSFDDEDAIETGLFASGRATVCESTIDNFDFKAAGVHPAWIVTYERDGEKYEQPYGIGRGWDIDRKGRLIAKNGQKGLPKSCNAIKYLVKPLKEACAQAKLDAPKLSPTTVSVLVGLEVDVERVEQEARDFGGRDKDRTRSRDRGRGREDRDENRGPRTILQIQEIFSAPWVEKNGKGTPPMVAKTQVTATPEEDEEDDEQKDAKSTPTARSRREPQKKATEKADASAEEDAMEALIALVAEGPLTIGEELEDALELHFKGQKGKAGIVDLAASKKFLQREEGWAFDGKVVSEAPKRKRR